MAAIAELTALVLFAVFLTAGVAKLADLGGSCMAVEAFGMPSVLARPVGVALPVVELTTAALLLVSATAVVGAVVAVVLLALFTVLIGLGLARGRTPDCHCFGRLHSAPAGRGTLARNAGLLVVAGVSVGALASEPGRSAFSWVGDLRTETVAWGVAAAGVAIALSLGWIALRTLRRHGALLLRIDQLEGALRAAGVAVPEPTLDEHGLPIGTNIPDLSLVDEAGVRTSVTELVPADRPLLLLFTGASCEPCHRLLPEIAAWQADGDGRAAIVIAATGAADEIFRTAAEHELESAFLDEGAQLFSAFQIPATPGAVLIDAKGCVASAAVAGTEAIRALWTACRPSRTTSVLKVGQELPSIELPLLGGGRLGLGGASATGRLVVFWNPGCGYCRQMHEDLLALERRGGRELVIVSSGGEVESRLEGFRSPVVLDQGFAASSRLGATGTPMALALDAEGRVASQLVAGRDEILALMEAVGGRA